MTAKKPVIPKSMWNIVIPTVIVLVVVGVLVVWKWDVLMHFFQNPERIRQSVRDAGPLGPLVFIGLQFLQILIAPIPGQAAGVLAGALFGPWLGTLYSILGALLGFTTVFVLAKLLGRPFVERFVEKKDLEKFDAITKKAGPFVLFMIFLLPGFPDDIICYIAGLSDIRIRTLVLVSLAGRLPGYVITSFMGAGIGGSNARMVAITAALVGLVGIALYVYRKPLKAWVDGMLENSDESEKK